MKLEHSKMCREAHEKIDHWLAEKKAEKLKLKMVNCLSVKTVLFVICCRRKK